MYLASIILQLIFIMFAYTYTILSGVTAENSTRFVCVDGTKIHLDQVCDGVYQCPDGSDETSSLCYHITCPSDMFRCYYGACIKKKGRCDGTYNCVDKSDESNCGKDGSCKMSEFQCSSRECIPLEKVCNGAKDCRDASDERSDICKVQEIVCPDDTFRCKFGGCVKLETLCNGFNDCIDGSDESRVICDRQNCSGSQCNNILCPPLTSQRAIIKCKTRNGSSLSCDRHTPVGTIATWKCKTYYKSVNTNYISQYRSICQPDGTWNRGRLLCEPECGITAPLVTPLIVHGWIPDKNNWPWHATLYSLQQGNWTFWCGGSLISENAVVTAAHCVWPVTAATLRVALGKHFRVHPILMFNVAEIVIHPLYQDIVGNYGSDIAIIILNTTVQFSEFIRPVCIDWQKTDFLKLLSNNTLGMIMGMGLTEDDEYSTILKATYLPVVPHDKCIQAQNEDFKKYVTFTTFCAGWQNGTGVCNGDSGGGLVFDKFGNQTWFLEGIVSVSPRRLGTSYCDINMYTVLTKVDVYIDWFVNILATFGSV